MGSILSVVYTCRVDRTCVHQLLSCRYPAIAMEQEDATRSKGHCCERSDRTLRTGAPGPTTNGARGRYERSCERKTWKDLLTGRPCMTSQQLRVRHERSLCDEAHGLTIHCDTPTTGLGPPVSLGKLFDFTSNPIKCSHVTN